MRIPAHIYNMEPFHKYDCVYKTNTNLAILQKTFQNN